MISHIIKFTFILLTTGDILLPTLALFTSEDLNSNPYLKQYDKINYDTHNFKKHHLRSQRSIDPFIYLTFSGHGKTFRLKLHESTKNSYSTSPSIELGTNKHSATNLVDLYEGILLDEPDTSQVSGTLIDGTFYGTIDSDINGKYFIEPAKKYNHTLQAAHSIIYHETDIDLEKINEIKKHKRSVDETESEFLSCGASKKQIEKRMRDEQRKMFTERENTRGFDPYSYIDPDKYHLFTENMEHETNKYTREANERKKRATNKRGGKQRVHFPGNRTMCDLYLRVDPQLYTEIFKNEGNEDHVKTVSFILFYLNKHVEALNSVYNGLRFFDSSQQKYYVGVQFMIYRTKIITQEQCHQNGTLTEEELKLCVPFLDVSAFLNYVSLDDFDDYCLSYTFTARDFTDGTLGLAWVAKLTGSVGGVCERRQTLQGIAKSLNSGIVTVVNYKSRVPEAVSQITFAHEVGHNFGSEHDPDDSQCSPGMNKGGNYIMYRRATTGTDNNNRNFSQCSKDQMGPVIHSLVENPTKFCFKKYDGQLCGNGIVEIGEECDCGFINDCEENNCCHHADSKTNKCMLKKGAECSPSQGPCCNNQCIHSPSNTICMLNTECLNNVTCTGHNASCPRNENQFFKPALTPCNSGTQVCRGGECAGSICEAHGMVQCYLQGNLKDKKQDKAILCHLACIGNITGNVCMDSFKIKGMSLSNTSGLILKPGSPCTGTLGYCDIFSKCRPVDGEGPLSRLKNLLLNPVTLSAIREWVTRYWWAVMLMTVGVLVFMTAFIKVCSVHTPSSNPRKPAALKISDTLRRPMKNMPHPHMPHMPHLHLHRSTPSAPPPESAAISQSRPYGSSSNSNNSNNNRPQVVNEKYAKNQNLRTPSVKTGGVSQVRSKSKSAGSSKHSNGHVPSKSHSNHITDKSHRSKSTNPTKLANMFTLKKRTRSMEPIDMQNIVARTSSSETKSASKSSSSSGSKHSNTNRNVENLPALPEVIVIKNVKRSTKTAAAAAKKASSKK